MSMKPWFLIVLCLFAFVACGGRVPTAKTAQRISKSYFKSYGRKFKSSDFGYRNLRQVTVNSVEEISYRLALADVHVSFLDGKAGRALLRLERKFPQGWTVVSWERVP